MTTLLTWLACLAPIAALFVGIAFLHAKIPTAAGIGLAVALLSGIAIGGVGEGELLEGISSGARTALSILYAVWPAMFLYDIMRESGAFATLRRFVQSSTQDMLALVLLFGWVLSSFLQSITGFGVPVAVCAPFLVALGIRPVPAVIITLVGHSWGNTFGTLGMAWDALVQMGPVENTAETAVFAGAFLWAINLGGGIAVACIYGGRRALVHGAPLIAILSLVMGGGQMALATIDSTIACFLPATAALAAFALLVGAGAYRGAWDCPSHVRESGAGMAGRDADTGLCAYAASPLEATSPNAAEEGSAPSAREAMHCASPFFFLAALSVALFAIPEVHEAASVLRIGGVEIVGHAGFALTATCIFAAVVMSKSGRTSADGRVAAGKCALARLGGTSIGILLLVILAQIMQSTGQMQILAEGIARAAGKAYIPLSPALGTFGAFVTSSNMSSNILLAGFQREMADALAVNPSLILAAQTAGGAAGAAIGPSTILLGAATVGASGKEGDMLRPLLAISFAEALLLGVFVLLLA